MAAPTRPLPGAPRTSAAALPTPDATAAIRAKIDAGTATMEEITRMTLADLKGLPVTT